MPEYDGRAAPGPSVAGASDCAEMSFGLPRARTQRTVRVRAGYCAENLAVTVREPLIVTTHSRTLGVPSQPDQPTNLLVE
jgi:hypothetical protein